MNSRTVINRNPESPAMRTLLLTLGATPQVVTETFFALARRSDPFVAEEIHLITTLEGERQAKLHLLGTAESHGNQLAKLCAELCVGTPGVIVHLIRDADGQAMDDIRSVADQDQAADQILAVVRRLTQAPQRQLHVSLAGGRKTMGFYLAYALSIYGREADELSHVLVNAPFESHHEFFYPPQTPRILSLRDGKTASTTDARIMLAPIPYVRLRGLLPEALIVESHDYRELVRRTQTRISGRLDLYIEDRLVTFGESRFMLTDTQFTWLYWFAERAANNREGVKVGDRCKGEFMACAQALVGASLAGTRLHKIEESFDDESLSAAAFGTQRSRLNKKLTTELGPRTRLRIIKEGRHSQSRYRLDLAAEDIHIHR